MNGSISFLLFFPRWWCNNMAASLASVDDAPWTEFHSLGTDAMQLTARARLIPQLASKSFFFRVCSALDFRATWRVIHCRVRPTLVTFGTRYTHTHTFAVRCARMNGRKPQTTPQPGP